MTLTNDVAELSGVVNLTSADVTLDMDGRDWSFKDIMVRGDQADLRLRVKWSKTIQIAADAQTIILHQIKDSPLCPLSALIDHNALTSIVSYNLPFIPTTGTLY